MSAAGSSTTILGPPRSLKQAVWCCRKRDYRKYCLEWLRYGPDAAQLATPLKFKAPDNLWQAVWRCRDQRYLKEYFRWLRFGPDEEQDAEEFNKQWQKASSSEDDRAAVEEDHKDQRIRRQTSIANHKSDVSVFYTIVAVVLAGLAIIAPEGVQDFIGPSTKPAVALLLIALVMALASYTNKLLYPLYTHFVGAAKYSSEVIDRYSYVNKVRKEANQLGRTLQRGKRLFSLSKLFIYAAGAYLVIQNLLG